MRPLVSIICLAYNHENFISECIEGFLMQKTNFPIEILIHDDASTDNTATIIKNYECKHPGIIHGFYESENQYSKGIKITDEIILPRVQGKYIAICEGDDGWTDSGKLQMQIDFLEKNTEYVLCVHNTEKRYPEDPFSGKMVSTEDNDCDFDAETIILKFGSGLFHTSSFVYRTELALRKPNVFQAKGVGDYTLAIYLATCGKVHYIGKNMSYYRVANEQSWTGMIWNNMSLRAKHCRDMVEFLREIDKYTNKAYHNAIDNRINNYLSFESEALIKAYGIHGLLFNRDIRSRFTQSGFSCQIKSSIKYLSGVLRNVLPRSR